MRLLLLLLVLVAIALAVQAPAWLLWRSVQARSDGTIDLRNIAGTLWSGQADAVVRGKTATARDIALARIAWRVDRFDWRQRELILEVRQSPAAARPAIVALGADRIRLTGGALLPAAVAGRLPLLTGWVIGGETEFDTDAIEWVNGTATGAATALWRNAGAVPPDLPGGFSLGEVTGRIMFDGAALSVALSNRGGDLELTGGASSRTGKVALLLQPRTVASGAQIAWLQTHTTGNTPRGYTIDVPWPGR